jgi:membrane protease subunit (stomatin/prohibitin family)
MPNLDAGKAFSTGVGLAVGLMMTNSMFPVIKPPERVEQAILCQKCGGRNPEQNRFCSECGRNLYPPLQTQCPKCGVTVAAMKFCGVCGALLQKQRKRGRK